VALPPPSNPGDLKPTSEDQLPVVPEFVPPPFDPSEPLNTQIAVHRSDVDLVDVLLIVIAAVCSLFFSAIVALIAIYMARSPQALNPKDLAMNPFFVIPTQVVAYILVVGFMAFLASVRHGQGLSQAVHWKVPSKNLAFIALGGGAVLGLSSELASNLLERWTPKSLPIEQFFRSPGSGYLLAAFGVLAAPLVEELFFRGFVYPAVARWTGSAASIIITGGAFAALHGAQLAYAWAPLMVLFAVGVVLTVVRARTGSVATCVFVHMGYNLVLFILLFLATGGFHHMERM
jgi:membrane protease YdiL (CAAX protease family)